jgi:rhodanese-related sulfurtransferase
VAKAAGYENVVSMKWGMSAWHSDTSGPWVNGRSNEFALEMETGASPAKNAAGELPTFTTGLEDPAAILDARAAEAITQFGDAKLSATALFMDLEDYYVVNFWSQAEYEAGHIPGAVMYEPAAKPFTQATDLLTLPTDQPVVIYCYTGQTSAYLTGYLRTIGYDARTLLYGANGMFYDGMPSHKFVPENEVKDYPLVKD